VSCGRDGALRGVHASCDSRSIVSVFGSGARDVSGDLARDVSRAVLISLVFTRHSEAAMYYLSADVSHDSWRRSFSCHPRLRRSRRTEVVWERAEWL